MLSKIHNVKVENHMTTESSLPTRPTSPGGRRDKGTFAQRLSSSQTGGISERALYETAKSILAQWQMDARTNNWLQQEDGLPYLEAITRAVDDEFKERLEHKLAQLCGEAGIPGRVYITSILSQGDTLREVHLEAGSEEDMHGIREKLADKRTINFHLRSVITPHAEAQQKYRI